MTIELDKEKRKVLVESIRRYFDEELDQEIGDLKATLFLDFCLEEVGGCVYNQAVSDAETFFQDKLADLETNCWQPELEYWKNRG